MSDDFSDRYRTMQRYLGWSDEDARRVQESAPLVLPHAADLIGDFYGEIRRHPDAMRVITGGSAQMVRLSRTLHAWLVELLSGPYDDQYMARRWKVGHRHVEIGLAQRYASLALARLRAGIIRSLEIEWRDDRDDLQATIASIHKLLDLEHALIQDAYEFEYVRRERQLERDRSERQFRYLVESASCLIVILNSDHDVVYFNPHAERTTGFTADQLRQEKNSVMRLLGRDPAKLAERLGAVVAGGGPLTYEDQITVRSGEPRWINWTLSRMDDFEDSPAALAVGHDVTEAKQAAEQLLQASRLAAIGQTYAGLAHESRNALQRLRACTDMLSDLVGDRPSAVKLLERAVRAQEDLQLLLDEVRNYAAPIVLEKTECRISALWREGWSLLQIVRRDRRVELVDDGCDPTLTVHVDRFRLVQAFRNILENSLASCGDPSVIRIECRTADLEGSPALEIVFADNGPGFDAAALPRAFEPFFTTKSSGTGLGLAIVRRFIEAHGGRISAANSPAGGARICLTIPLNETQAGQSPTAASR